MTSSQGEDDTTKVPAELGQARERFLALVSEIRPELHRYCARLTGSVVDGEDIVQETLARAFYAMSMANEIPALRPWLFRVAHNTAIDLSRRYERRHVELRGELEELPAGDAGDEPVDPAIVRAALSSFLELPITQRSAVILKDVLGQSLAETAETIGTSVLAVKAALSRGRATLRAAPARERARAGDDRSSERKRLEHYAALFNARDWDALRSLLAEECRLDLVSRASRRGKEVHEYFERYATQTGWHFAVGDVEHRLGLLVRTSPGADRPDYFILLEWEGERVSSIRDFRYVSYVARELAR